MNNSVFREIQVMVATMGFLVLTTSARCGAVEFVDGPEDQTVWAGDSAIFVVEPRMPGLAFQWFRHAGTSVSELKNQTNETLVLSNVSVADVGLYYCQLTLGDQVSYSQSATLYLQTRAVAKAGNSSKFGSIQTSSLLGDGSSFTVFGPVICSTNSVGSCPGVYEGYVSFAKLPSAGWGWAPSSGTTIHTATDENRTNTAVVYMGRYGDSACAPTTVTLPDPGFSPTYRFTIFFPNDVPQTNAYPITLSGFDP